MKFRQGNKQPKKQSNERFGVPSYLEKVNPTLNDTAAGNNQETWTTCPQGTCTTPPVRPSRCLHWVEQSIVQLGSWDKNVPTRKAISFLLDQWDHAGSV